MKKRLYLLLGATFFLFCVACGEKPREELPYDYNAMVHLNRYFCDTGDTVLIQTYINDQFVLLEFDKKAGVLEYFCKNASCTHLTNDCPAGNPFLDLENYHGQISMLRTNTKDRGNIEASISGYVSQLKNNRFELGEDPVGGFIHAGGHLYVHTTDVGFGYFPSDGGEFILLQEESHFRGRAEIGEYIYGTEFFNYPDENGIERSAWTIARLKIGDPQAKPETVYEFPQGNIGGLFRTDGEYLYYEDEDYQLMRCDLNGGNETQMTDIPVFIQSVTYEGEYLYFSWINPQNLLDPDNGKFYRMKRDGSTTPELLAQFDKPIVHIFPALNCDFFFVFDSQNNWMLLDKDGTNLREIPWV